MDSSSRDHAPDTSAEFPGAARVERIGDAVLMLGDCRDILPHLGRVDAVVTDPPYHGVKRDGWDNQWATDAAFLGWAREVCGLLHGVTSPAASLYWFASPQMASRLELVISERFRVLNNIVWDKSGSRKGVGGTGIDVTALRGYWSANTERVIFAERLEGDAVAADQAGYEASCVSAKCSVFGDYLRAEFHRAGVTNKAVAKLFPSKTGGLTGCVSNWLLGLNVPTQEQYSAIRYFLGTGFLLREYEDLKREYEDLKREYEDLKREYEDLKREYEDLRRPFFVSADDEWGDVWRFAVERNPEHPTQKPLPMMRHIVKVSSRADDVVLDPFMGSGSTGAACAEFRRSFIGIEREPAYFDIACRRIAEAYRQPRLFDEPPPKPTQGSMFGDAA
jgi:adenine-specific DNA-methyltransferase